MPINNGQPNSNHKHIALAKATKLIVVGIDFGTSTTKVMYRSAVDFNPPVHLVNFAHGHPKFPSFVMPSSIRLDSEYRFWFGDIAEAGYGKVFRSFKVCAACQVNAIDCRGCHQNNLEKDPPLGRFKDDLIGFITAHELMIYYLAWLLDIVNGVITYDQRNAVEPELQYNLGVPVSHLATKPDLVDRFEWILHISLKLRGKIQQGISAAEARSHLIEVLPASPLPPPAERNHRVLPETAAAAMWLQKTAADEEITNYMLIDIGAGTTDITVYRYAQINSHILPIYGANSVSVAADNIDFTTIQWFANQCGKKIGTLPQLSSALLQEMRCIKEALPRPNKPIEAVLGGRIFSLDEQTYIKEIVIPHAEAIYKTANETFREAYQLARRESHWQKIKIVLLGGGSRIVGIDRYFSDNHLRHFMKQQFTKPQIPDDVVMKNLNDFQLLAVAYGLAFPSAEFPDVQPPNRIQPLPLEKPKHESEYNENALLSN